MTGAQTGAGHTPTPWFVSGVRLRMNGGEWHMINRYDEDAKQDENIACVGYDPRTGVGLADAHKIVQAVNSRAELLGALKDATDHIKQMLPAWKASTSYWGDIEFDLKRFDTAIANAERAETEQG